MTAKNLHRDAILDELAEYGVKPQDIGHGGKHPYVAIAAPNGARLRIVYPSSGHHNGRALANVRAHVRKVMRQIGIKPLSEQGLRVRDAPVPIRSKPPEIKPPPVPLRFTLPPTKGTGTMHTNGHDTNGTAEAEKQHRISRREAFLCGKLLEEHGRTVNGVISYEDGWNDDRVAAIMNATFPEAGGKIKARHVQYTRSELFPEWKEKPIPKNAASPFGKYAGRLAALEARVQALEDALTKPGARG